MAQDSIDDAKYTETKDEFDYIISPSWVKIFLPVVIPTIIFLLPAVLCMYFPSASMGMKASTLWMWGVGLTVLNVLIQEIRRRSEVLKLNKEYLVHKVGIFSTSGNRVNLVDIRNVKLSQGLFERMIGVGTVEIATSGTDGYEIKLCCYPKPKEITKYLSVHHPQGE